MRDIATAIVLLGLASIALGFSETGKSIRIRELKERIDLLESRIEALERETWPGTMTTNTTNTKGACNR